MEEFLKNFSLFPRDAIAIPLMALVFAVFWRVFGSTVISRHLALLEAREKASLGARDGADQNLSSAAKLNDEFEQKLSSERISIAKSLEPKISSARAEAARIVESAEAEALTLIETTRSSIVAEQAKLLEVIEKDADSLASTISERALA